MICGNCKNDILYNDDIVAFHLDAKCVELPSWKEIFIGVTPLFHALTSQIWWVTDSISGDLKVGDMVCVISDGRAYSVKLREVEHLGGGLIKFWGHFKRFS